MYQQIGKVITFNAKYINIWKKNIKLNICFFNNKLLKTLLYYLMLLFLKCICNYIRYILSI